MRADGRRATDHRERLYQQVAGLPQVVGWVGGRHQRPASCSTPACGSTGSLSSAGRLHDDHRQGAVEPRGTTSRLPRRAMVAGTSHHPDDVASMKMGDARPRPSILARAPGWRRAEEDRHHEQGRWVTTVRSAGREPPTRRCLRPDVLLRILTAEHLVVHREPNRIGNMITTRST